MKKIFFGLVAVTLMAIFLVILAGSVVRTSESGMGCPDWPKCFGQWIPPTSLEQLPENYREIFLDKRLRKVEKYTSFLTRIGQVDLAQKILKDPSIYEEEKFNATKTWIEYVNRLLGFMAGNFMIILVIMSIFIWKDNKKLFIFSLLSLIFTGIQGWFGSLVVASNLTPWTITFHMLFALLIIFLLIRLYVLKYDTKLMADHRSIVVLFIAFFLALLQIYMGTQVRQEIDILNHDLVLRSSWIESLSSIFEFHRSFAILVILVNIYLFTKLKDVVGWPIRWVLAIIGIEVLTGIIMAYFGVPKFAQPIHLLFSTVLFGLYSFMLLRLDLSR